MPARAWGFKSPLRHHPSDTTVPNVIGFTVTKAQAELRLAGLTGTVIGNLASASGIVGGETPGAGSRMPAGPVVQLRVASGPGRRGP